ncbi:hypothetical protein [Paraburkholderia bryophila]|uniref:Uncharacterized protein n=1 Tax=Paraburkholderia bryophila TaxID=420952 RepID=A0A7Y9WPJ4_9BURK|nr:hypothetical protein [Paraburkholderia bryophila]NYH24701.1 hypothetical protein [Paraburkholderia bryophila]
MESNLETDGDESSFYVVGDEQNGDGMPAIGAGGTLAYAEDGTVAITLGFRASIGLTSAATRETIDAAVLAWAQALVQNVGADLVAHIVRVEKEARDPTAPIVH